MENNIFLQISALLGITVSIAFLVKLLKQPLMIAYIVAGIISGPLFLNLLNGESHMFEAFAQFGIVLLLFVLGLNLDFNYLKKIGRVAAVTGTGQVLFTFAIGLSLLLLMGMDTVSAGYLALAITFSSTIIIVKLLNDKRDTESIYGRHTIGLMLVQDIIAIAVLLIITSITTGNGLLDSMLILFAKGVVIFTILYFISKYLLPGILNKIASHGEFLFIFTITWCFGVASLIFLSGFSIEIGAVVAGLILGSSPYQKAISSRIKPLRDFFIVLFFIILGSEMGLANFGEVIVPGTILSLFILIGNPLILYILFRLFKFTRRNSFLSGVTAAQVSEFGFILVFTGQSLGHIGDSILPIFTFVALTTIFISSYLITYSDKLFVLLRPVFEIFGKDKYMQRNKKAEEFSVWVFGYHRMGWKVCELLKEKGISYAVVDFNHETVEKLNKKGVPAFFGDVSDVEFLEMLPLEKSKMIISTFPDPDGQSTFIEYVRGLGSKVHIVATLNHNGPLESLYSAGADYILMPHLLGGKWMHDMLSEKRWSKKMFSELKKEQISEIKARRISLAN